MDGTTEQPDEAGTHIWLRHATQFMVGEHIHTLEMSVPVPIGASTEMREQLLREAEAGLAQLASYVEGRGQRTQLAQSTAPAAKLTSYSAPLPSSKPVPTSASGPLPPPVSSLPPREVTQPAPIESKEPTVSPTRPGIGATLPNTTGLAGDASGNIARQQFIRIIKESYDLVPRQAMDLLKVRSLDGLNLRDALKQLQQLVGKEPTSQQTSEGSASFYTGPSSAPPPTPLMPPFAAPASASSKSPDIREISHAVVRENSPAFAFDEEVDVPEDEENEEEVDFLPDLTDEQRAIAEHVLDRLKEARGLNPASSQRLIVLNNVISDQLSNEQLEQLVQGVWGIPAVKKLKSDQVEALISWAKEDEFVNEAEAVLTILQGDQYASSDR